MTALTRYQRIEATGLWRAGPKEQRRDVIVSLGEATLVITDTNDTALTHWSLAAVTRVNPNGAPAIFSPDGDPGETLELGPDEAEMIEAIETLRRAIERARPQPGRLRVLGVISSILVVVAVAAFWLPSALRHQALAMLPDVRTQDIGARLLERIERVSGAACDRQETRAPLQRLAERIKVRGLIVLPGGVRETLMLPGGLVLLNKSLLEDYEDPSVPAGFILAERTSMQGENPLNDLLVFGGPAASFRLLTTSEIDPGLLTEYAEHLLTQPRPTVSDTALLSSFEAAQIPSSPYAYALDVTGETVLPLIEADPMAGETPSPVLNDRDWVLLQNICVAG